MRFLQEITLKGLYHQPLLGAKLEYFHQNNSKVIHKKVHSDNLSSIILALFGILALLYSAFLWYFVFVMQCIVHVRIYYNG